MNQTRVFLIFAWLMVATLLWFEWSREKAAPAAPAVAAQTTTTTPGSTACETASPISDQPFSTRKQESIAIGTCKAE